MKNKIVGWLIIIIAALMAFVLYSYYQSLNAMAISSCSDVAQGLTCPVVESSKFQVKLSVVLIALLVTVGAYLILFSREEKIVTKIMKVKEQIQHKEKTKENYKEIISELNEDEKQVFEKILDSHGSIIQSELVSKTGFSKVSITRILDKLEGKDLIERRRRGMTNIVILKH